MAILQQGGSLRALMIHEYSSFFFRSHRAVSFFFLLLLISVAKSEEFFRFHSPSSSPFQIKV